jgi:hypothetical protein
MIVSIPARSMVGLTMVARAGAMGVVVKIAVMVLLPNVP